MEFIKGQKVKLMRGPYHQKDYGICWVSDMPNNVGKIGTVIETTANTSVQVRFNNEIWCYPNNALEIVEDYKNGDTVFFIEKPTRENMTGYGGYISMMDNIHIGTQAEVLHSNSAKTIELRIKGSSDSYTYNINLISRSDKKENKMTQYTKFQEEMNIVEGDILELTGVAKDGQLGWLGSWDRNLDDYIGYSLLVRHVNESRGYTVVLMADLEDYDDVDDCRTYEVPFFCVTKLEEQSAVVLSINGKYTAVITSDGVKVGCQNIDLKTAVLVGEAAAKFLKK